MYTQMLRCRNCFFFEFVYGWELEFKFSFNNPNDSILNSYAWQRIYCAYNGIYFKFFCAPRNLFLNSSACGRIGSKFYCTPRNLFLNSCAGIRIGLEFQGVLKNLFFEFLSSSGIHLNSVASIGIRLNSVASLRIRY